MKQNLAQFNTITIVCGCWELTRDKYSTSRAEPHLESFWEIAAKWSDSRLEILLSMRTPWYLLYAVIALTQGKQRFTTYRQPNQKGLHGSLKPHALCKLSIHIAASRGVWAGTSVLYGFRGEDWSVSQLIFYCSQQLASRTHTYRA